MSTSHNCKNGEDEWSEVGIVINPKTARWEFYHPEGREEIFFCPYCGRKLKSEFETWLVDVGIPTLKDEIDDFEAQDLKVGLISICEMIYKGSGKK